MSLARKRKSDEIEMPLRTTSDSKRGGGRAPGGASGPYPWDADVTQNCHVGAMLAQRICDYDAYANMMMNRKSDERRRFIAAIKTFVAKKYRRSLENPECPVFREQFERFFDIVRGDSQICNILQMYICHIAVLFESRIREGLCPPPPDPNDPTARDSARIDRFAFSCFEQKFLLNMFFDLRDGTTLSVPSFVRELNAAYMALLPSDPLDAALADRTRTIEFSDDEARNAIRARDEALEAARARSAPVPPPSRGGGGGGGGAV